MIFNGSSVDLQWIFNASCGMMNLESQRQLSSFDGRLSLVAEYWGPTGRVTNKCWGFGSPLLIAGKRLIVARSHGSSQQFDVRRFPVGNSEPPGFGMTLGLSDQQNKRLKSLKSLKSW